MTDNSGAIEPTRIGGATWCEQHGRFECVKNRKQSRGGGRCHQAAIRGLDRCRVHVGVSSDLAEAQGAAMDAWSAANGTLHLSPEEAVVGMYKLAWVRANFYSSLLEEQVLRAQEEPAGTVDDDDDLDGHAAATKTIPPIGEGAGLIGYTFSSDREHGIFASGEAIRGLVQLEAQERDRVVKFAKAAHDMGIAEREIRIAEQQGELLASAVRRILDGLNLSVEQQRIVPQLVPQVLRMVAAGGTAAA